MKNKQELKEAFEEIKKLDVETLTKNINYLLHIERAGAGLSILDSLHYIENKIFDNQDRECYNFLLERKPISYDFSPSLISRCCAILAIFSDIHICPKKI
jgi:hypothetical protein